MRRWLKTRDQASPWPFLIYQSVVAHPIIATITRACSSTRRLVPSRPIGSRGAAMVEFCIAAVPFMMLIFGTLELGMIFVTNLCLTNATSQIARQIRTGQITLPGNATTTGTGTQMTLGAFKAAVCKGVPFMATSTCMNQLQVDVRVQSGFSGSTAPRTVNNGNFSAAGFCFYSGSPGNVVTMRAYMLWPIITPGILNMMANVSSTTSSNGSGSSGTFMLMSTSESFKNEPNPNTINTGSGC